MRRIATIGFVALSTFFLISCAGSNTPQGGSTSEDTSQGLTSNSGGEGNPNSPPTSEEIGVNTADQTLAEPLPEIELDRAELLASSEVDIALAQEFARNRALGSFKLASDLGDQFLWEEGTFLWEEAIPHLNEAIEADPSSPEAHLLLGYVNFQLNNNDDAIVAFEKSIELDPRNFEAHFYLGVIYLGMNELPKSIDYLTQSIELATNPSQISDAFARRALSYHMLELYDTSFADIKNALYLDPNNGFTLITHSAIFKDKVKRDREATGKEGIPGVGLGVDP